MEPAALLTVATATLDDAQVAWVVRSCVELSENTPVATNCWFDVFAMLAAAGDTSIDTSLAGVTDIVVLPVTPPLAAAIEVVPTPTAVANPMEPAASLTVATVTFDDAQATWVVMSCVELSENTPVAVNCRVNPFATTAAGGVTSIDTSVAAVTVNVVVPVTLPLVADTVVLPTLSAVTRPFEPAALLTAATVLADDAQVTWPVRSRVELSV